MTRTTLALVLQLLVAACGSEKTSSPDPKEGPPRPAVISDDDVILAEKWAALHAEYASAMVASQANCQAAVAAVRFTNKDRAALIARGKPRMAELRRDPAAARWLDDRYRARIGGYLDQMAPTLDSCRGYAELSAALAEGAFEKPAGADQPR
jgi:hypothetical protein